jgi:hypothetical protein
MQYCSPHHYTPTSESVDFLNTVIGKALISSSLYPSSSTASFQQELRFVAEPNLFSSVAVAILYVSEPIEVGLYGVGGSKQQL